MSATQTKHSGGGKKKQKTICFDSNSFSPWFLHHLIYQTNQLTEKVVFQADFPICVSCNLYVLEVQMNYFWMNCYSIKDLIKAHWIQHYYFYWFQCAMFSQEYLSPEPLLRRKRAARTCTSYLPRKTCPL